VLVSGVVGQTLSDGFLRHGYEVVRGTREPGKLADWKAKARVILDQFGWEIEDLGAAAAASTIEALCVLWCIPGFLKNDWRHALKMLR